MELELRGCNIGGGEESELGGASIHLQHPPPISQVTRETLSSRAGATVFNPIFLPFGDQDLALVIQLVGIYVCDQDGGTPLDSDLDQGAGEEANSPAGGARGVGGVVGGGVRFYQHQDCVQGNLII